MIVLTLLSFILKFLCVVSEVLVMLNYQDVENPIIWKSLKYFNVLLVVWFLNKIMKTCNCSLFTITWIRAHLAPHASRAPKFLWRIDLLRDSFSYFQLYSNLIPRVPVGSISRSYWWLLVHLTTVCSAFRLCYFAFKDIKTQYSLSSLVGSF